jgi:hypothetical protein
MEDKSRVPQWTLTQRTIRTIGTCRCSEYDTTEKEAFAFFVTMVSFMEQLKQEPNCKEPKRVDDTWAV